MRSHSTASLNCSGICIDVPLEGCGGFQFRHTLHVSTMDGIISKTVFRTPLSSSVRRIAAAGACHHRRCAFRNSRRMVASVPLRRVRSIRPTSKLRQSAARGGPVPEELHVRLVRGSLSGPRVCGVSLPSASASDAAASRGGSSWQGTDETVVPPGTSHIGNDRRPRTKVHRILR